MCFHPVLGVYIICIYFYPFRIWTNTADNARPGFVWVLTHFLSLALAPRMHIIVREKSLSLVQNYDDNDNNRSDD